MANIEEETNIIYSKLSDEQILDITDVRQRLFCGGVYYYMANKIVLFIRKNDSFILYMKNNDGKIIGLCIFFFDNGTNSIYVDIICSPYKNKTGSKLIQKIIEISNEKQQNVHLHSIPKAVGFYEKYGFINQNVVDNKNNVLMEYVPPTEIKPVQNSPKK
jgi:hypothetical protein